MKRAGLVFERKSQVLIAVLIAFTIMLTLGVAIMMHSRAGRTSARIQTEEQKAYQLAQSGIAIGESVIKDGGTLSGAPYNISGGIVTVTAGSGQVRSESNYQGINKTITKNVGTPSHEATCWVEKLGGGANDFITYVHQDDDGGYILGGKTLSFGAGSTDFMVVKTNSTGKIGPSGTWQKAYGLAKDDYPGDGVTEYIGAGNTFSVTDAGTAYIFGGGTTSFKNSGIDFLVMKVSSSDGSLNWARAYRTPSDDVLWTPKVTTDGGYLLGGRCTGCFSSKSDSGLVIKTNSQGQVGSTYPDTWVSVYDGSTPTAKDNIFDVDEVSDGYILGGSSDEPGNVQFLLIKAQKNDGSIIWKRTYGGASGWDYMMCLEKTSDGGFILVGRTLSLGPISTNLENILLIKTDADGRVGSAYPGTWAKVFDLNGNRDETWSIQVLSDGYILGGTSTYNAPKMYNYALVIKTKLDGTLDWARYCRNSTTQDIMHSLATTSDGYIYGISTWDVSGKDYDFLPTKVDSQGDLCCSPNICTQVTSQVTVGDYTDSVMDLSAPGVFSTKQTTLPANFFEIQTGNVTVTSTSVTQTPICE